MISFGRRLGLGVLLVAGLGCGASLPSDSNPGDTTAARALGDTTAARTLGTRRRGGLRRLRRLLRGERLLPGDLRDLHRAGERQALSERHPAAPRRRKLRRGASSNLPGVQLAFPDQPCSYTAAEVAAGIEIVYDEVITAAVARPQPGARATPAAARGRTTRASSSATGSPARVRATASATPASARRSRPSPPPSWGPTPGRSPGTAATGTVRPTPATGRALPSPRHLYDHAHRQRHPPDLRRWRRRRRHVLGHGLALNHDHAVEMKAAGGAFRAPPAMRTPASAGRKEFLAPTFVRGEPLD